MKIELDTDQQFMLQLLVKVINNAPTEEVVMMQDGTIVTIKSEKQVASKEYKKLRN